eukprot:UN01170
MLYDYSVLVQLIILFVPFGELVLFIIWFHWYFCSISFF